jgi:hypothetical protein
MPRKAKKMRAGPIAPASPQKTPSKGSDCSDTGQILEDAGVVKDSDLNSSAPSSEGSAVDFSEIHHLDPRTLKRHHGLKTIIPQRSDEATRAMGQDVKELGLIYPVLCTPPPDPVIIDGEGRVDGAIEAGAKTVPVLFIDPAKVPDIWRSSLHRRHLTESQRALVAFETLVRRTPRRIRARTGKRLGPRGTVVDLKRGCVALNLGEEQGVVFDGILLVLRSGQKVAKVSATDVSRHSSSAKVIEGSFADIRLGDKVEHDHSYDRPSFREIERRTGIKRDYLITLNKLSDELDDAGWQELSAEIWEGESLRGKLAGVAGGTAAKQKKWGPVEHFTRDFKALKKHVAERWPDATAKKRKEILEALPDVPAEWHAEWKQRRERKQPESKQSTNV